MTAPRFANCTIVDHPLIKHKLTLMRRVETSTASFRALLEEISLLLGYEAMREIRKDPRFRKLPIIAVTAKAMADDQEKCLEAGANDYLAKPIDLPKLLSLIRVGLHPARRM